MKFRYEYRTRDNARHEGVIDAPDREGVYAALKAQGVRPSFVAEVPGFFNKLFGKGKRWLAIGVLSAMCGVLAVVVGRVVLNAPQPLTSTPRHQIYGDPSILQSCEANGWAEVLPDAGDRLLAAFAQPGRDAPAVDLKNLPPVGTAFVGISADDPAEAVQMKRIVNGMKTELADYLAAGGTVALYVERLLDRQKVEKNIRLYKIGEMERLKGLVETDRARAAEKWRKLNDELRAFGLCPLEMPEDFL